MGPLILFPSVCEKEECGGREWRGGEGRRGREGGQEGREGERTDQEGSCLKTELRRELKTAVSQDLGGGGCARSLSP